MATKIFGNMSLFRNSNYWGNVTGTFLGHILQNGEIMDLNALKCATT